MVHGPDRDLRKLSTEETTEHLVLLHTYTDTVCIAHLFNPPLEFQVKISLLVFHNAENIVWAWPAGADTPLSPAQPHNNTDRLTHHHSFILDRQAYTPP